MSPSLSTPLPTLTQHSVEPAFPVERPLPRADPKVGGEEEASGNGIICMQVKDFNKAILTSGQSWR